MFTVVRKHHCGPGAIVCRLSEEWRAQQIADMCNSLGRRAQAVYWTTADECHDSDWLVVETEAEQCVAG